MSAPLMPSPLDYIGRRRFALYPAIRHADPNEWVLGTGSWSEVQFVNSHTGSEIWVPRVYIGAVSDGIDTLVIGLTQNLELRGSEVQLCARKRLIEMPRATESPESSRRHHDGPAPVIGIRLEKPLPSTFHKTPFRLGIFVLFVAGLLALMASTSHL